MLNKRVAIYIPSKIGQTVHIDKQRQWVRKALDRFSDMFGGATAIKGEGAFKVGTELILEDVVIIFAFTSKQGETSHRSEVIALAKEIADDMKQLCVSVEINGGMEFIE